MGLQKVFLKFNWWLNSFVTAFASWIKLPTHKLFLGIWTLSESVTEVSPEHRKSPEGRMSHVWPDSVKRVCRQRGSSHVHRRLTTRHQTDHGTEKHRQVALLPVLTSDWLRTRMCRDVIRPIMLQLKQTMRAWPDCWWGSLDKATCSCVESRLLNQESENKILNCLSLYKYLFCWSQCCVFKH